MARNFLALGVAAVVAMASAALGQIPFYQLVGQFNLPAGAGTGWDVGPDGRVWGIVGDAIVRQDGVNGSTYSTVGSVPSGTAASWGASFLRVSPTGSMIAIGDNNFGSTARVSFVSTATLSTSVTSPTTSVLSGNFDGAWSGNQFYVSGAGSDFVPFLSRITFSDATGLPTAARVVSGIGGASGGVAVHNGRVYTGVGYGGAGLPIGQVRWFDENGLVGGAPVAFTSGTVAATALSASPLAFDAFGNLLVGGGDSFGGTSDVGYAAVIDLNVGFGLHFSPAGTGTIYGVAFNNATHEMLVTADGVAYRYGIPGPGAFPLMGLGVLALGRRRRA